MNKEIKRIKIAEEYYTETDNPFTIKPSFLTLGRIIEITIQGPVNTFVPDNSTRSLLCFFKTTIYEEDNLSPNPVVILSFDNFFLRSDIAQVMVFRGKRSGIIHNFTMDVDLVYIYIEKFRRGIQRYMMESKDIISSISCKLKMKTTK